jgi:CHAT domain-containing protein/lipopolysaccharide biosynthesis regulator YciM
MHQSSSYARATSRIVTLSAIAFFLPHPLTSPRAFPVERSQEAKLDASQQAQNPSDVRKLEVGKPIEREMKGGESHTYEIELQSGQYLNAVVDQRGIDVVVTVIGPDGKQIMEVDSPNGAEGPEPVSVVASVSGNYRLIVRSPDRGAAKARYEIRIADMRAATADDRALQEALKLYGQAIGLRGSGQHEVAIPLAESALAIREKVLAPNHPDVATSLYLVGRLYYEKGDYTKAESFLQRSLTIGEKALGPEHPEVAETLNALAGVYEEKGDYVRAEPLSERALAIREKVLSPESVDLAGSLNNLARLYAKKGDYAKAEHLYQRTSSIVEKALGPNHPILAASLNNLATLYITQGYYAKAKPLLQRVLAIVEKALPPEHPYIAQALNNLASLYTDIQEYAEGEPLHQRALAIREKVFGPEHQSVAESLSNLATLYHNKKDYVKAEALAKRVVAIFEKALGPEHPNVALALNNLAVIYKDEGDVARAIEALARCNQVSERNITYNIATGSERQKLLYLSTLFGQTNSTICLHVQTAPSNPAARNLALTTVLQRKGRALDAMTDSIKGLRRRLNSQDRELLDQLTSFRSQLATLVLKGPGKVNPAQHQAEIKRLEEQVEKLEGEISRRSAEFRAQTQTVTLEAVQAAIPSKVALVEFVLYRPINLESAKKEDQFGKARYVAYLLRGKAEPQWAELGEANAIDNAVDELRKALRDPKREDVKRLARAVDEKVMQPVRKLLGETRRVLISPDGALNLIPFAALVDERGQYLVKQYSFTYLTSGRDLLRLQVKTQSKQGVMVVADPDFGGDATPCLDRKLKIAGGAVDFSQVLFCPLAGTAGEAQALQALMPDVTVLMKQQATETAVKQAAGPKILHIATHGFFLEDVVMKPAAAARGLLVASGQTGAGMKVENPLLRSGLGLAGANLHKSGDDDGVLTALEASGLDLWGTKLVVLSACDTGVGEVKNGDGVYGLRRALVLAGSESQVMSLWSVNDEATRDLMIEYYTRLQAGEGRAEALRKVQLKMLANKNRRHPYYWASFIESGEWANLDGKR